MLKKKEILKLSPSCQAAPSSRSSCPWSPTSRAGTTPINCSWRPTCRTAPSSPRTSLSSATWHWRRHAKGHHRLEGEAPPEATHLARNRGLARDKLIDQDIGEAKRSSPEPEDFNILRIFFAEVPGQAGQEGSVGRTFFFKIKYHQYRVSTWRR